MASGEGFDPNGVGIKGSLFGLPYDAASADIVVIPIPWDVTASYGAGAAEGPLAILNASSQIDYELPDIADAWRLGVAMAEIPEVWHSLGKTLRAKAQSYIDWLESGSNPELKDSMKESLAEINEQCGQLMTYVKQETTYWHNQDKATVLLGGDHSTVLGYIEACMEREENLGVLQIDAHADLRNTYEGFTYSHASIMHHVLQISGITKLVQVGVRDYCQEESVAIKQSEGRIITFFDQKLKENLYQRESWHSQCEAIVSELPEKVYVSFDIDGLDPKLCPNTGTPVPGGFEMEEINYLLKMLVKSGRKIVGADLNEVSPGTNEWDANVGARALYRLTSWMGVSQGLLNMK